MQRLKFILLVFVVILFASCSSNQKTNGNEEIYIPKPTIPLVHYLDSISNDKGLLNNEVTINECAESIKTDFEAYKGREIKFLGLLPCVFDSSECYETDPNTYFVQFSYNDNNSKYDVMLHVWCKLSKEQVCNLKTGESYNISGKFRCFENTSENALILPNGHCGNFSPSLEVMPTGIPFFDLGVLVIDDLRFSKYSQQ